MEFDLTIYSKNVRKLLRQKMAEEDVATVKEFCKLHGLDRQLISYMCNAKKEGSIETRNKLANALGVSVNDLYRGD